MDYGMQGYGMPQQMAQMSQPEVQKQLIGEQLYVLVQAMTQTPVVAQKVTGMLLELPMPELLPLFNGFETGPDGTLHPVEGSELKARVEEALSVLQEDAEPDFTN